MVLKGENQSAARETLLCHLVKQPELYIKIQSVPRSKTHLFSVINMDELIMYTEIKGVCSESHMQNINATQKVEYLDVEAGGTYSNHSKGLR